MSYFSKRVFLRTSLIQSNSDILTAVKQSRALLKQINAAISTANKRVRRIEAAGEFSPAIAALEQEGGKRFSTANLSWEDKKNEYARAVAFMQRPTSLLEGVRQYNRAIREKYDLTEQQYEKVVDILTDGEDEVSKMMGIYKDMQGDLARAVDESEQDLISDSQKIADSLEQEVINTATEIANYGTSIQDEINNILKGLNILK